MNVRLRHCRAAYKTAVSFFDVHTVGEHDE